MRWLPLLVALAACGGSSPKPAVVGEDPPPAEVEERTGEDIYLAMVLLAEEVSPDPYGVVATYGELPGGGAALTLTGETDVSQTYELEGGLVAIGLMPAPVPDGEAVINAEFSVSAVADGWVPPSHAAHLVVSLVLDGKAPRLDTLKRFTRLIAAVTEQTKALGVYWNGIATHKPEFVVGAIRAENHPVVIWNGVSIAQGSGRIELLSTGMHQLELPELLLAAAEDDVSDAFQLFFDLLAYVADRGKPIGEGETVGHEPSMALTVHYVPSPLDPKQQVWRVEMP